MPKEKKQPTHYAIEEFEVVDDISVVDKAANRCTFVAIKRQKDKEGDSMEDEKLEVTEEEESEKDAAPAKVARKQNPMSIMKRMFDMMKGFFEGGGAEPIPVKERKEDDSTKAQTVKEDKEMQEYQTELAALKVEIEARGKRIEDLEKDVTAVKREAKKAAVNAQLEGWATEGKLIPAARPYLEAALMEESMAEKAEDGETTLSPADCMAKFMTINKAVSFKEVSSGAPREDLAKYGGKTAKEYAAETLKSAGKKVKEA